MNMWGATVLGNSEAPGRQRIPGERRVDPSSLDEIHLPKESDATVLRMHIAYLPLRRSELNLRRSGLSNRNTIVSKESRGSAPASDFRCFLRAVYSKKSRT